MSADEAKPIRRPSLGGVSPILGLPIDDAPARSVERTSAEGMRAPSTLRLSVVIPARDEERNLPGCLESLVQQSEPGFALGQEWEICIVDDASTDNTRAVAESFAAASPGITVWTAPALATLGAKRVFTGKTNACWHGAQQAQGEWLLFTDADTLHELGDLGRALHEAERHEVALLSYSPRQIVQGVCQRVLMPLVFSELATVYPPAEVNDPSRRIAAANGQFLMVKRDTYFRVGGHKAVGAAVLEDVALAELVKRATVRAEGCRDSGCGIRLRYAPEALSTRMYTGLGDMMAGWRKNLALLFPHALALAFWRTLDIALFLLPLILIPLHYLVLWQQVAILAIWARTLLRFYRRIARSHFPVLECALAPLGLPLFVYVLVRSWMDHRIFHQVTWRGREYR